MAILTATSLLGPSPNLAAQSISARTTLSTPVQPFPLDEVKLTGGPWLHSFEIEQKYLLSLQPERFLSGFRKNAGLTPLAPEYGGWENSGLAGHTLGHYLSACSQAYDSTGDPRFLQKIDAIVDGLDECQAKHGDGYLSAIPEGIAPWERIRNGDIRSGGFDLNGMWSPWYTVHKQLAGLLDAYQLAGSKKALIVAKRFADWMLDLTNNLDESQWQKMLRCEYGGMNDALARLYQVTGDSRYLALAHHFYDHAVLDPILAGRDNLDGLHSNTQLPKIIGLATLSDTNGGGNYKQAVKFFWNEVIDHHTYVIGGNGDHESFTAADKLAEELTSNTCETCCTYNMLKLTRDLFEWNPDPRYLDYYERAHLNDILASQDPETAMVTYFFPLESGQRRTYSNPEDDFTCCHGSGMENHTKHQDSVYFHSGADTLYVAQFIPTNLDWHETGLRLKMETDFPKTGRVTIVVQKGSSKRTTFKIRHPEWAGEFKLLLNGKVAVDSKSPDSYIVMTRKWKKGDALRFDLPMKLHTVPIPGDKRMVAIMYGPSVLAADLGRSTGPDFQKPVIVPGQKSVSEWVTRLSPSHFEIKDASRPSALTLKPIYDIVHDRYAVYFDLFSKSAWAKQEADYRAQEQITKDLESRTIDLLRVGEMQPERDHNLKSASCDVREVDGKGFRTPYPNGWFDFDLKVDPGVPNSLVVTYWVNTRMKRSGVLTVDGQTIATVDAVDKMANNTFQIVEYPLPPALLKGKTSVRVRFSSSNGKASASVASVRSIRSN